MAGMGRPRSKNTDLPPRMHIKRGVYYYVTSTRGADGKTRRRWIKLGSTYLEAIVQYGQLEAEASDAAAGTFGALADRYLAECLGELAEGTRRDYKRAVDNLRAVFGALKLTDIRPHHVAQYLDQRSAKTAANREKAVMSTMFSHAIRWGWADTNPTQGVRRHKETARERYITDDEFQAVWECAPASVALAMDWAYVTSQRESTVLGFRWQDIDEEGMLVQPSKGGKAFRLRRTDVMEELLERSRRLPGAARSMYLIHNRKGQPYTPSGFRAMFRRALLKAGVEDFHFHDIRGKSLTDYEDRGEDAQALAGHRTRAQTDEYIKRTRVQEIDPNNPKWRDSGQG